MMTERASKRSLTCPATAGRDNCHRDMLMHTGLAAIPALKTRGTQMLSYHLGLLIRLIESIGLLLGLHCLELHL